MNRHVLQRCAPHIHGWTGWLLLAAAVALAPGIAAQTAPPAAPQVNPGPRIIVRPAPASPAAAGPFMDPLFAAMQQGIDQVATASAEFDPPVASLGQRITYRVVVTAMIEGVSLPDPLPIAPGLALSPSGRGFTYGTGGGALIGQPRTTCNYRVSVTATGAYVMPAYTGSANGKPVKIPEARLTVLPPGAPVPQQPLRLTVETPPGDYYIGQSIPMRLVLLDPGNNTVQALAQPQVSGEALMSEMALMRQGREVRPVGGRMVAAHVTVVLVTPVKEGRLQFTGQAFAYLSRPGTAPGFGGGLETVLVDSDPVFITVKHLPKEGELPGFTGGIGKFQVELPHASTNEVHAGEPLTLSVIVRGEGNLTRLVPPRVERLRDWQAFPPLADTSGSFNVQARGTVVFTYTLIPLNDRLKATPPIPFCYFDPERKAYVDATIPPVPLKVLASPGGRAAVAEAARLASPGSEDPDQVSVEKELVLTGLAEKPGHRVFSLAPLQSRPWFLVFQLVPALALGGVWLWDRRRRHLARHPEIVLKARARRRLSRHLRCMRRAAAARDEAGYVASAVDALREAFAPFEAANPQAVVCSDVLRALPPEERESRAGQLVRTLFAASDARRFLGQTSNGGGLLALSPELEALLGKWRARL
jgi:hypothetical protein